MALATLSIDIEASIAKMQEGMDKAGRIAEKQAAQIDASFAKLEATAASIGQAIASAFVVHEFSAFVRGTVDALDALNDVADATGSTIEKLSALEDIARRNGGTLDQVSSIMVKFNSALKEADGKNGVSQALAAIGLNAKELKEADPSDALKQVADALARFGDDGNKARLVQELFGKSIKEAAPFLKDLADAGQLNATVTAQQAAEAEKFNKQMFALKTNINNAGRAIVSDMIPALEKFLSLWDKMPKNLSIKYAEGASVQAGQKLETAVSQLEQLQYALDRTPGGNTAMEARIAQLKAEIPGLQKAANDASQALKDLLGVPGRRPANEGGGKFLGLQVPDFKGPDTKVDKEDKKGMPLPQDLQDAINRINATDMAKVERLKAELKSLFTFRVEGQDGRVDQAIANVTEELEKANPAFKLAAERAQRLQDLLEGMDTAEMKKAREDMLLLAAAMESGEITAQQFTDAVQMRLAGLAKEAEEAGDKMSEFTRRFAENVQDALGSTVEATMKGNFDNIGKLWGDMLLRMATQAVAADIGNLVFGDSLKKGGGSDGGLFGKMMGLFLNANGNAFSGGVPIQAFASGGVVGSPTLFGMRGGLGLMGEAGPEAIMPLKRGRDGKLGVAGGGANISIGAGQVINVGQGVSRAEVFGAVKQANDATLAQVHRLVSTGRLA